MLSNHTPASSPRPVSTALASRSVQASDATRLRVLAGTPHSRRGSVLVLVVGVLALLAIIIVVYTSVGQADVRGGRTIVNQARMDDQSLAISDYIRRIVGDDASATKIQPVALATGASVNLSVREGMDYPYTDPYSRSQLVGTPGVTNAAAARFDPAGNITRAWTGADLDPRVSSDPFLASTEPTWINRGFAALPAMPTPGALLGHHRDWAHMSMISPSGLPVNLANLRDNWTALSGFSTRPYAPDAKPKMSDFLVTWADANNNAAYLPGPNAETRANNTDLYNSPAFWSNNCTNTFRPVTWNPRFYAMGDVRFMGNMLGDADGDGFYDSRWQELVDVSDPNNPVNLLPGGTGGGLRWFIAPRIVDLSSMVNVNTATGFGVPPDVENPAGLTPSDVDFERLLTMADARQYFGVNPQNAYVMGATYGNAAAVTAAGRWAFAGILEGRGTGLVEVLDNSFVDSSGPDLVSPPWLRDMGVQRSGGGVALGSVTRKLLYQLGGKDDANGQLRNPIGTTANFYLKQTSGYGNADELELRSLGAVNDPRTRSRIESSAATMAATNPTFALMNPFRPDRDIDIDRNAGLVPANTINVGGETVPRSMAQYFTDVRHLLTTLSGARPLAYSASLLANGASAARPITDAELRQDVNVLLRNGVAVSNQGINNSQRIYPLSAANAVFTNYAMALAPFLGGVGANAPSNSLWNEANAGDNLRNNALSFGGVTYKNPAALSDMGETDTPQFKGRAAEIAVRSAGHMALNLLASRDDSKVNSGSVQPDNRLLAATVLLDETQRGNVGSAAIVDNGVTGKRFPFWQAGNQRLSATETAALDAFGTGLYDIKGYTFDLNGGQPATVQRLAGAATTPAMTTGYAVNIFAAQPQPFITAAVSFDMYYDAPRAQGGDSKASGSGDPEGEWYLNTMNVPPTIESLGVTIKGDVSEANQDFLMEAVAFQVTNPFDADINLGDSSNFAYYFEFAGKYYDARPHDEAGNIIPGPFILGARRSMCFYILSQSPAQLAARWRSADPGIDSTVGIGDTAASAWITRQLSVTLGGRPSVRTVQIDVKKGNNVGGGSLQILDPSSKSNDNKVVKLWRVVRSANTGGVDETATNNAAANDYLVDRLHDPHFGNSAEDATLFRRLSSGQNRFIDMPAGPEPGEPEYVASMQRDNIGYAITLFGSIRRRTDPNGGPLVGATSDAVRGVLPAWCVEAKMGPNYESAQGFRNITDVNPGFPNVGTTAGITSGSFGAPSGATSFRRMIQAGIAAPLTTAAKHPATRTGSNQTGPGFNDAFADRIGEDRGYGPLATASGRVGWIEGAKAQQLPVYPRRATAANNTEIQLPPLRPADLLMPWPIGPYQYGGIDPRAVNDSSHHAIDELRHTTLGEAMALALNYCRSTDDKSYEFQIGQVLDRCHLPTDRQVPFNDANSNATWDYNAGNADPYIANGIPFALNILDRFRTTRYGSIDSVMPGLVNLNTAPLNVVRMLPFLTPASANVYGNDGMGFNGSWTNSTFSGPFALRLKDETGTTGNTSLWANNQVWDVAAAIVAYRDQQAVVARGEQGTEDGNTRVYIDFSRGQKAIGNGYIVGNDNTALNANNSRAGRPHMTKVPNARQEFGIQTPGEVLLAVVQDNSSRTGQNLDPDQRRHLGINRMVGKLDLNTGRQLELNNFNVPVQPVQNVASNGLTSGTEAQRNQAIGLTSTVSVARPSTGREQFVQGGVSTDYDRKLGIANAILNTVSTTSDIYCAYFLVHGYSEADTQGLETYTGTGFPTDERYTRPMTPSVQRRYMMVLDRSECVRAGDKPKVLMFEELPVN